MDYYNDLLVMYTQAYFFLKDVRSSVLIPREHGVRALNKLNQSNIILYHISYIVFQQDDELNKVNLKLVFSLR